MGWLQDLLQEVPLSSVLRERVTLAEQKYAQALEDLEASRRRVAELEQENRTLRAQIPPAATKDELGDDTRRVLVYLFKAKDVDARDVGNMARASGMERSVMQYHLDRLRDANLAESVGGNYRLGHVYWATTSEGRRYVVERDLVR
jgi:DNA-binding transcriptional ArsR family regulator